MSGDRVEGRVKFKVGDAFYRPSSALSRDLGVLAAALYRGDTGGLRVLDAMAGCGARSLRYWVESGADWVCANDANPDLHPILQHNLTEAIATDRAEIVHRDANALFFECYNRKAFYDLVDVDAFGSPAPYLTTALWSVKLGGLFYLTTTDGRTATGREPETGLRVYGAYPRAHPAMQEQGLRLAIGGVQQQAAARGQGIDPVFSLFSGHIYRVMVRLVPQVRLREHNYGWLGYCHHCGEYAMVKWRKLGRAVCPHDGKPLTLSGPLWLGDLHDRAFVRRMQGLAVQWHWTHLSDLLETMAGEADFPPYFYTLGEIGRRGQMDVPKRDRLIEGLQQQGDRAVPTHVDAQAVKTDTDLSTCIKIARQL
jgi:tRNA (guanine26-N2/guanine27-N2)-dimethyltransferase